MKLLAPDWCDWRIDDAVTHFRVWGTETIYRLPPQDVAILGTGERCSVQIADPSGFAEAMHVLLLRDDLGWSAREIEGTSGFRCDGARRRVARIEPGFELAIGGVLLVAQSPRFVELRCYVARLLGWSNPHAVDRALRSLRLAATGRAPLVLHGPGDLIAIAHEIHRHTLGVLKPFVVSDPRRRNTAANPRSPANDETASCGLASAEGGSWCVWRRRLPADFAAVRSSLRDTVQRVQLIVCVERSERGRPKPDQVEPIMVPPLAYRQAEIKRIVDEYAHELAGESVPAALVDLNPADRAWIVAHAGSISDVAKSCRRLLALRQHDDNCTAAARSLGVAPIVLLRWLEYRGYKRKPRPVPVPRSYLPPTHGAGRFKTGGGRVAKAST
jgi:hypothetical protein